MKIVPDILIEVLLNSLQRELEKRLHSVIEFRTFMFTLDIEKQLKRICNEMNVECNIEIEDNGTVSLIINEEVVAKVKVKIDIEVEEV